GKRLTQLAVTKAVSERKVGATVQMMIDTHVKTIVVIAQNRRRDKVLKRHVAVWQWIQVSNRTSDRVNQEIRNDAVCKRQAGEWTNRRTEKTLREVTGALERGRNVCDAR